MDYRTAKSPACDAPADSRWALAKARVRAWTTDRPDVLLATGVWLAFAAEFVALIGAPAIAVALSIGALGAVGLDRLLNHITRRSERKP